VLTQPRPRGGIARVDAGCEPYLNRIGFILTTALLILVTALRGPLTVTLILVTVLPILTTATLILAAATLILMTAMINNCHGDGHSGCGNAHSDDDDDQ
jgi:hypothetical protein